MSSWYLLRGGMEVRFALRSFAIASGFGLAAILSVIVLGDESGYRSGRCRRSSSPPSRRSGRRSPPRLLSPCSACRISVPRPPTRPSRYPYLMGIIATRSLDERVTGLKDLKAQHEARIRSGMLAHEALEAMRADGSNQAGRHLRAPPRRSGLRPLAHPYARRLARRTRRPSPRRWMTPSPGGAAVLELSPDGGHRRGAAGALCRRLPAAVPGQAGAIPAAAQGPVLVYSAALDCHRGGLVRGGVRSPALDHQRRAAGVGLRLLLQPGQLWFSLIAIFLIYSSLLVVELFLLRHVIRKGPASLQTGRYQGEVLQNRSPA